MKPTAQQASNLLEPLQEALGNIVHHDAQVSKIAREKALKAARSLVQALETPEETILHHAFGVPPLNMCVRVAVELHLFQIIEERVPASVTAAELARGSGADRSFIVRVMRLLTAAGYAGETNDETYRSNSLTKAMNTPVMEASIKHRYDVGLPALAKAPTFYATNGFQPPTNRERTAFQLAFDTNLCFYDYMAERPALKMNLQTYIKSFQMRGLHGLDVFPVEKRIIKGFSERHKDDAKEAVLLVDVGCGQGQDIKLFQQRFPHVSGRLILQDRDVPNPQSEKSMEGIELQEYNFFTPQPIQGARAYLFRRIFSNWSDEECAKILRTTVEAVTPNYSRIILNEVVYSTAQCSLQNAALDIIMMTSFTGLHRSESHWRNLLASTGLREIKFWYQPGLGHGVIEAVRGEQIENTDSRIRAPTYHTTSANYMLPNDAIEYARLEDQATGLAEMMHNHFIHGPLQSPHHLIDIGCGSGIITCQLGNTYPAAQVYGVDLSPVPPGPKPPNVEYITGDVRQVLNRDTRLALGSADFVSSRLLVLGMTDWAAYVQDMASLLLPGGWVEMQDYALDWYLHGAHCSGEWEWLKALFLAAQQKGLDLYCGRNVKKYMQQAGLVDISEKEYRVPMGSWLVKERPETKRIGKHAARKYGMLYYHAIPKMLLGMGYTEEKIEEFRRMSIVDLAEQEGKELRFYATIGRKP